MSPEPIRITRQELYEQVWSKTLRKIAEELGTSYVELVRACTVMNVPRPQPGHWESVRLGFAVERVPLPADEAGTALEIFLRRKGKVVESELPPLPEPPRVEEATTDYSRESSPATETVVEAVQNKEAMKVTRQKLYEKVWVMSLKGLAKEWGTSYLQLVAACELMNVPRPPSGHWVRVSLGLPVEQIALPEAGPGTVTEATLEPIGWRTRPKQGGPEEVQAGGAAARAVNDVAGEQAVAGSVPGSGAVVGVGIRATAIVLPPEGTELHPIAERHWRALEEAKPGELGFVSVGGADLFPCEVSSAMAPRLVRALHTLVCELEQRDYGFKQGEEDGGGLGIVRGDDMVGVRWGEAKIELEREPTNVDKRKPSWTWNLRETKATGQLTIEVGARGLKGKRKWAEGEQRSLEEVLGVVVEKIGATFRGFENQRKREAELAREREEAAERRAEEEAREAERQAKLEEERKARERVRRHQAKLEQITELRRQNLLVAARLWIESRGVAAYIGYCEATWRVAAGGALTQAQADWLAWAKAEASSMGPFGKGYPDLARDGKLDVGSVPVGGPYPEPTELEALEEAEPGRPPAQPEVSYVEVPRAPEQFPFWYLHRGH